jgi:hypothetical protein
MYFCRVVPVQGGLTDETGIHIASPLVVTAQDSLSSSTARHPRSRSSSRTCYLWTSDILHVSLFHHSPELAKGWPLSQSVFVLALAIAE